MTENIKLPTHVGIIMDGNGRWAEKKGVNRLAGHNQGMLSMKEIIKRADVLGIKYLTVYAFSTENWKRSGEEVGGIFELLVKFAAIELRELKENNVRVRILGEYKERLPKTAINAIDKTLKETEENTGLQFNIALNYGSRAEICRAMKLIAKDVKEGLLSVEDITEELVSAKLYTGEENDHIPDPDLIIRTSGEMRLSNFLLWQTAYSELFFSPSLWPEFTPEEFEEIVREFSQRGRRFGGR